VCALREPATHLNSRRPDLHHHNNNTPIKTERTADFFKDFDRLNKGDVNPANFLRALSLAGVDRALAAAELAALRDAYTAPRSPAPGAELVTRYARFLDDVDAVFTVKVRAIICMHAGRGRFA
jgi:hypothetical protein